MTERVDAGPCIAQASVDILPDETALELAPRMAEAGAWLTCRAIDSIEEGNITEIPQDPELATLAPKLKKSDGQVEWTQSAETIRNQVRAMQPWPKTFTHWQRDEGEPLSLILDAVSAEDLTLSADPGMVIEAGKDRLLIATGSGAIRIDRIQPAGKRVLSVEQFLRGYPVKAGQRMVAGS
jgi:methionyl-tRNA formyltransferase